MTPSGVGPVHTHALWLHLWPLTYPLSKLLWELCCRNALAHNSSPSFILFVRVNFPLWPPSILTSSSWLCPSISGPHFVSADFILPGGCNHARAEGEGRRAPPKATGELFHLPSASPQSADWAPDLHCFLLHRQAEKHSRCTSFRRTTLGQRLRV